MVNAGMVPEGYFVQVLYVLWSEALTVRYVAVVVTVDDFSMAAGLDGADRRSVDG